MNPLDLIISQFKTGWKTSEFWLVLLAGVWNAVYPAYHTNESWKVQVSNLVMLAGAAVYAFARSYVKGKRLNATATVVVAANAAINAAAAEAGATDPGTPPVVAPPDVTPPAVVASSRK